MESQPEERVSGYVHTRTTLNGNSLEFTAIADSRISSGPDDAKQAAANTSNECGDNSDDGNNITPVEELENCTSNSLSIHHPLSSPSNVFSSLTPPTISTSTSLTLVLPSFACNVCHKRFSYQRSLTRHRKIHKGDRPYICSICNKDFIEMNTLKVHMALHTGNRPHQCTECEKTFTLRGHLHAHLRTHTGERPFRCPYCQKAFKESGYLKKHVRIHTGDKPYKCSLCEKTFTITGTLKSHMKTHWKHEQQRISLQLSTQ